MSVTYVWRVPTLLGVMACCGLLLFAGAVMGSAICRRRSQSARYLTAAILALLAIAAAIAIRATAEWVARSLEISVAYVDPGAFGYLAPPLFAAFAFAVGRHVLKGKWTGRSALLFYAWLLVFTAANIINVCSPGWCETFGFPLTWHAWSDSIITFDGDRFSDVLVAVRHLTGGLLNLLTFVVVGALLSGLRVPRRSA